MKKITFIFFLPKKLKFTLTYGKGKVTGFKFVITTFVFQ